MSLYKCVIPKVEFFFISESTAKPFPAGLFGSCHRLWLLNNTYQGKPVWNITLFTLFCTVLLSG